MKYSLKLSLLLILLVSVVGCSKQNTANGKFTGTWHTKGAPSNSIYSVTFFNNGTLQDNFDNTLRTFSIISPDSIQINSTLSYHTHRSFYVFYSERELYIEQLEGSPSGIGFNGDTLVRN